MRQATARDFTVSKIYRFYLFIAEIKLADWSKKIIVVLAKIFDISWMSSIYILWYFHLYDWDELMFLRLQQAEIFG